MQPDKLLIVAHPDDEVLWGGANLLKETGWFVVCSTHANDPIRSQEFYQTMSYANVTQYEMFDVPDTYVEADDYDDEDQAMEAVDELYDGTPFDKRLATLAKQEWKLVLTHNADGEYGHLHHKKVHYMVRNLFPAAKFFTPAKDKLSPAVVEAKRDQLSFYRKTQAIAKQIYEGKSARLKKTEKDHFFHEKVFVSAGAGAKIPRILHQIWFGTKLDPKSVRGHLVANTEKEAIANGFEYRQWTNDDLTEKNFPLTWEFIQRSLEVGEDIGQNRYAQVADLARMEILHRFGGVYCDSLFELSDKFFKYIVKHAGHDIIVCNEDPCSLDCKGIRSKPYLSNGFFACKAGCKVLKRLLDYDMLESVDYESIYLNQETGPYYFRKGIHSRDNVHVIPTEKIYPFMVTESEYREAQPNPCVSKDGKVAHNCLDDFFPDSLTIYHSGFGGSWSW
jgi:LmbE family N-acetylglucosaminyl deacetylase